jgi:hypothetical protein
MVGPDANPAKIFYYADVKVLHVEIIDRRNCDLKHLLQLVDADGVPVPIPADARFRHVMSDECLNLLDHHLRHEEQESRLAHA